MMISSEKKMKNEHLSLDYPHSLASYFLHCYTVIQIHFMLAKFEIKTQNFGIMVTITTHKRNTTHELSAQLCIRSRSWVHSYKISTNEKRLTFKQCHYLNIVSLSPNIVSLSPK